MWHNFSFHCFIILLKEVYTMTDSETFMTLGMSGNLATVWTVIFYVTLSSVLVLMRRIFLYLLTTLLFTVYWGFVLYWGGFLSGVQSHTTAFAFYTFCGLAITCLAIIASFKGTSYDFSVAESDPK